MATFGETYGRFGAFADIDIHEIKEYFVRFLNAYRQNDDDMHPYYVLQLDKMMEQNSTALYVNFSHLVTYDFSLADVIAEKYLAVEPYLRKAVQNFVETHAPKYIKRETDVDKEFYLSLWGLDHVERFRDLKTAKLGKLVAFSGTVTRSTEVRPELALGTFRCLLCSTLCRSIEQQFKFTYPVMCSNPTCNNKTHWSLVREESHFLDWQRLRVQENTDEVPAGSLPRTTDVILRGTNVEKAKPGDKLVFTGTFIVVPDVSVIGAPGERAVVKPSGGGGNNASDGFTGPKQLGARELTYRTAFLANAVQASDARSGMVNIRSEDVLTPEQVLESYEEPAREKTLRMQHDPDIWYNLTKSIAPGVYGHDQVKQAILLMLIGGVHKKTKDGTNLRGDINVAIIGDPACAKSQLLKYVSGFLPRAVYTSGKSSTAAGLTATVVKDSDTAEFCIEAGALMLADNGICCIDEFDKMDVKDQVAIHEAMEQQTISISKAGINATLNARASILAAANPIGGRYDKSRPLKQNIALPPAILSRFDLVHVMLDETTEATDARIAAHIIGVHRLQAQTFEVPYSTEDMQRYIKYARALIPRLTPEAKTALVAAYRELRSEDAAPGTQSSYRITVRQLEALIRLSEALARVHCNPYITTRYVAEAQKLLKASVLRVEQADVELGGEDDPLAGVNHPDHDADPEEEEMEDAGGDENAGDTANQQRGAAEAMDVDADGKAKPAAAPEAAPAAPPQEPRQKLKVDARKFQYVKTLLTRKLHEHQVTAEVAAEVAGESETSADKPELSSMGMRQVELMEWYLNHEVERQALADEASVATEFLLVERVIGHLVRNENLFIVVERPERLEGEENADYHKRLLNDRVLALHANYDPSA